MRTVADRAELLPLAWARIALAAVVIIRTTSLVRLIDPGIGTEVDGLLGWPHPGSFRAAWLGIVLPDDVVKLLCAIRTLGAVSLLAGYRPLPAGIVTGVAGYAVMLQDVFGFTFTQHLLFVGSVVIGLTDCAAVVAVRTERAIAPKTSFYLAWTFVTSVYFWAAICKLRRDWVDGRTLGLFYEEGKLRGTLADALLSSDTRRALAATVILVTELAVVPLLWSRRTRWAGLALAFSLHVVIEQVARPDVFGWAMIALLLSFVPISTTAPAAQGGTQIA